MGVHPGELTVVGDDARRFTAHGAIGLVVQHAVDAAVRVVQAVSLAGFGTPDVSALWRCNQGSGNGAPRSKQLKPALPSPLYQSFCMEQCLENTWHQN